MFIDWNIINRAAARLVQKCQGNDEILVQHLNSCGFDENVQIENYHLMCRAICEFLSYCQRIKLLIKRQ